MRRKNQVDDASLGRSASQLLALRDAASRLRRDRRALQVSWYAVFWVAWRGLVTLAVVISLVVFARAYISERQDTFGLQASLFVDRVLLDSPVVVRDVHTYRLLPAVLDVSVENPDFDGSICYGSCSSAPFAAKFSVAGKTWWFHRRQYEIMAGVPSGTDGPGGVKREVVRRAVLLRSSDGSLTPSVLVAEVLGPRGG